MGEPQLIHIRHVFTMVHEHYIKAPAGADQEDIEDAFWGFQVDAEVPVRTHIVDQEIQVICRDVQQGPDMGPVHDLTDAPIFQASAQSSDEREV